ncbi:hypothetical protein D9757_011273 [Collybiopsis confluens]|uniref:beta-galactosidase n=1 Tax=Collybiopsis confluens TaxID=2823264 RepID=A0A8H5LP73_9AGAR|nr:hypothetical protein D9757_011273 [Collybiopsis confluens]
MELANFHHLVALFLTLLCGALAANHTDQVQFDSHSLFIKGQRVFLHGGEFHTFRLPVPDLWIDILEKIKAAGLNSISVYTHMGLLNPSRGVVDFDDWRDLQRLFEVAREVGIWVTLRPGPYINAETTAGGIAHWITSEVAGTLRTNVSDYREAWTPYIKGMAAQIRGNEITDGGSLILLQIDNEYNTDTGMEYMAQLEATYREAGVVVPFTYNDAGNQDHFVNGTGAIDLHGNDYYPQRYNCSEPDIWHTVVDYWDYHQQIDPAAPFYVPEMQGGALNGWGPNSPQYTGCMLLTGPEFENVFYRQLWASNAKLVSYYMFYGGTSWGFLPWDHFSGVYTSYDYGGAISESRALTPKHPEIKLQGIFLRSSPEFYKTNRIGNSSIGIPGGGAVSDPSAVALTFLQNPDTGAGFWITRHNDSTSSAVTSFSLNVTTSLGLLHIPLAGDVITLSGHESKVIVTDYAYGSRSRMLYSTAQVFFAGVIDSRDVLFLYGSTSQSHEFALTLSGVSSSASRVFSTTPGSSLGLPKNTTVFSLKAPFSAGLTTIFESSTQLILFADTPTAESFYAPTISSSASSDPHKGYWGIGTNETVLIGGPYLVRSASISSGSNVLEIRGDLNLTFESERGTGVTIVAPAHVTSAIWNGQTITLPKAQTLGSQSTLVRNGVIPPLPINSHADIQLPSLSDWKFKDSLPEITKSFDDSEWTVANHTTTNIPYPSYYGDGRVLYGCDYEFCENIVLWRGHFNASGSEKSVNLSINGGTAFAASVWLNNVFLNTSYGNSSGGFNILEETDDRFVFPKGVVLPGKDNVITIVQDNMGLNETVFTLNDPKSPRGVRGFKLDSGNFSEWKVQGKVGGYTGYPDKVRGVFNEGGLFGERQGWHLPGFDTSHWVSRPLSSGLPDSAAGVGFFVNTFNLDMPTGLDILLSFTFEEAVGQPYRAYLFVNGWMLGKRVANLGPQFKFPVHEGILDYHGVNTVAVALWSMEPITISPQLELTVDGVFRGGTANVTTNNPRWSPQGRGANCRHNCTSAPLPHFKHLYVDPRHFSVSPNSQMSIDTASDEESKLNIVVIGGSYVGSKVVDDLIPVVHETHNILLVEKGTHFQNIFAFPRLHVISGFERQAFVPYTFEYVKEAHSDGMIPNCTRTVDGLVTFILPNEIALQDGTTIPGKHLVLATGTSQRLTVGFDTLSAVKQIEGEEKSNDKQKGIKLIHAWQADVERANSIAVIGGGAYDSGAHVIQGSNSRSFTSSPSPNFPPRPTRYCDARMKEFGIATIFGQRPVKIEKPEAVHNGVGGLHTNGGSDAQKDGEFDVHLSGREELRDDLVITCLGGTPLSEPLQTLAPSAIDPETHYIRVLPTLQIDTSEPGSWPSLTTYPNVFALGDVANTGAHKAARPGHFQSGVVTRNIQRLVKSRSGRHHIGMTNGDCSYVAQNLEQMPKGISISETMM